MIDCMPQAMKMDFVPYIGPFFPAILMGMARSKDEDEDTGFTWSLALVQRFGDLCPDLWTPAFESYLRSLVAEEESERRHVTGDVAVVETVVEMPKEQRRNERERQCQQEVRQ